VAIEKQSPTHQGLLKQLEGSSVSAIFIEPSGQWLSIDFISNVGDVSVLLKLFNPTLFKFSRTLDDEGLFVVGGVSLTPFDDGGRDILDSLGYDFRNEHGYTVSFPNRVLWHFHLEGDICIDVVCENYELLKAVRTF
jgi:hypothetical protein